MQQLTAAAVAVAAAACVVQQQLAAHGCSMFALRAVLHATQCANGSSPHPPNGSPTAAQQQSATCAQRSSDRHALTLACDLLPAASMFALPQVLMPTQLLAACGMRLPAVADKRLRAGCCSMWCRLLATRTCSMQPPVC